jgi:hypothetical protein
MPAHIISVKLFPMKEQEPLVTAYTIACGPDCISDHVSKGSFMHRYSVDGYRRIAVFNQNDAVLQNLKTLCTFAKDNKIQILANNHIGNVSDVTDLPGLILVHMDYCRKDTYIYRLKLIKKFIYKVLRIK